MPDVTVQPRFHQLVPGVRHYAWGQRASDECAPYLPAWLGVPPGDLPWAELWFGAHPSLPATVPEFGSAPLDALAAAEPEYWCGARRQVPFLLKLLACSQPLSIQSHPDGMTARRLHAASPGAYPDPNDKTEILIALEPFEALAGFRHPLAAQRDIAEQLSLGKWRAAAERRQACVDMRTLTTALFDMPDAEVAGLCRGCAEELDAAADRRRLRPAETLFLRLQRACPGDRGALFAFLLNFVRLEAGEACFLPPNTPHAYLAGVGVECMTNSDNVIRAGLTSKPVDAQTMLETLNFGRSGTALLCPPPAPVRRYAPPGAGFQVMMLDNAPLELAALPPELALLVVLDGAARLSCAAENRIASRGTAWVRPAALAEGAVEPLAPGTQVACALAQG